ncbi:MAG: ATP-dependent Clp protease proteolytic subunit [Anaerolineae bacterium]|nr:ATP-dependent Clp protease proteolytic subunit [Anaerolineae bacterium]
MHTMRPHWASLMYRAGLGATTEHSSPMTVETIDNHIYYYADVDSDRGLALMRALREKDRDLRAEQLSRGMDGAPMTPIWLHIYSIGGDLFAGFSLADQLATIKSPLYSVVEGICASAATLLALSCTRRYILPSSFMLVHQLSSFMWGTHEQFKDEMSLQAMMMERLVAFYTSKTKLGGDEVRDMLTRDSWMDAATCIKHGFADEILS